MKWVMFQDGERKRLGFWQGDQLAVWEDAGAPSSLDEWIRRKADGDSLEPRASRLVDPAGVRILAPLSRPGKIGAIGLNYLDHCREQKVAVPQNPMLFAKFVTAVIGPGDPICWDDAVTSKVDYEGELGVIIGKNARRVSVEQALDYVFGYTIINDVTARDLQQADRQWVRSKSLDSFCPMGPCVVSADEIPDPQSLAIQTRLNANLMQDSSTHEMVFGVAYLISFLSQAFTLEAGDVIATGTPNGVGLYQDPPVFLKHGDTVSITITGIGELTNPVILPGRAGK